MTLFIGFFSDLIFSESKNMSAAQTHLSAVPNEQAAFTQIYDCWGRNYNTGRRKNIIPQGERCYEHLNGLLECVNITFCLDLLVY